MRIEIAFTDNIKESTGTKVIKPKSPYEKLLDNVNANRASRGLVNVATQGIRNNILGTTGSRHNKTTYQNKVDNALSVVDDVMSIANMASIGAVGGPVGAAIGAAIGLIVKGLSIEKNMREWQIASLENRLRSAYALEALGETNTSLNR